jgi:tRNA nucleotidyltransferase/poly(A) polymerase
MFHPLPTSFVKVHPESPEAIAAMPPLTETQQALWDRVQAEGEIIVSGKTAKKTVEALAKRGLADYDAEYLLNEKHLYYAYRFIVRLNAAT